MTSPTAPPYSPGNIIIADAALYIAPKNTPLPADTTTYFDPSKWIGKTLVVGGATAITLSVTTAAGTVATSSQTTFTAAAIQTALQALSNVGSTSGVSNVTVTGSTGGPLTIVFNPALGAVTLAITASTGGTPSVVSALWVPPGATDAGWTFSKNTNTQDVTIEEQSSPVAVTPQSASVTIGGSLAEMSIQNLQFALNALKTVTAPATGQPGVAQLALSDALVHYAVALETVNPQGYPRIVYFPDSVCVETVNLAFRRAADKQMTPVTFRSVCATSQIIVRDVTAPGL